MQGSWERRRQLHWRRIRQADIGRVDGRVRRVRLVSAHETDREEIGHGVAQNVNGAAYQRFQLPYEQVWEIARPVLMSHSLSLTSPSGCDDGGGDGDCWGDGGGLDVKLGTRTAADDTSLVATTLDAGSYLEIARRNATENILLPMFSSAPGLFKTWERRGAARAHEQLRREGAKLD